MQIVVNLTKENTTRSDIEQLIHNHDVENGSMLCGAILESVFNGQVLPKGQGRLVDADLLRKKLMHYYEIAEDRSNEESAGISYCIDILDNSPTVVEAE